MALAGDDTTTSASIIMEEVAPEAEADVVVAATSLTFPGMLFETEAEVLRGGRTSSLMLSLDL